MGNAFPQLCCIACHRYGIEYQIVGTNVRVRLCERCAEEYRRQIPIIPV